MSLSIDKLQQLVAVAKTGSFSKAAIELNISQPALSRSIASLETLYGFKIFDRLGHGVHVTAAGGQVIAQAQPLLQAMRVFDNNLKLFGTGDAGQLFIGLAPLLASQLLSRLATDFFSAETKAQLRVLIRPGSILLEELQHDRIEMFFFPEGYIEPNPTLEIRQVGKMTPVCVVRSTHPLAERQDLTLDDLAEYPWASSVDPPIDENVLSRARFVCDNYHILRDAVLGSDLICICSLAFVGRDIEEGRLRKIRVEGLPLSATPIHMGKLQGRVSSPLAERALKRMKKLMRQQ